ncbi:MAG: hypothetical protein ACRDCX_05620, partial [Aeromonas sp.]
AQISDKAVTAKSVDVYNIYPSIGASCEKWQHFPLFNRCLGRLWLKNGQQVALISEKKTLSNQNVVSGS